jgi:hypothetical protein
VTEEQQPNRHHVGPVGDDLTDADLTELGRKLFDQITKGSPMADGGLGGIGYWHTASDPVRDFGSADVSVRDDGVIKATTSSPWHTADTARAYARALLAAADYSERQQSENSEDDPTT